MRMPRRLIEFLRKSRFATAQKSKNNKPIRKHKAFLCGPLRISAFSALRQFVTQKAAELVTIGAETPAASHTSRRTTLHKTESHENELGRRRGLQRLRRRVVAVRPCASRPTLPLTTTGPFRTP